MTLWDFARRAEGDLITASQVADNASVLASALLSFENGGDLSLTPGAGIAWVRDHLRPVVLADSARTGLEPGALVPLAQARIIQERVLSALGESPEWVSLVEVFSINTPQRQIAPGNSISGAAAGTIGTQVVWANGNGFVTAGHVAPSVGVSVVDAWNTVGTVVWSNDPLGHGTLVEPDVAIVELLPGISMTGAIANAATAGPAANVTVLSTGQVGVIMGLSQFLYMPAQNATCGDTYFTTSEISSPGDSGGPVLSGQDLIGHVVGASPNVTSFIQDVAYQLREAANPLRSGLLGLRM